MERKFNSQQKLHIRKGDTVKVLSGDDKNKTGKVLEILASKNRVLVEGINIITKHQKPSAGKPEGGIKKIEGEDELYRLRAGDYRILYQVKGKVLLVLIVGIGHRRDIYRRIGG